MGKLPVANGVGATGVPVPKGLEQRNKGISNLWNGEVGRAVQIDNNVREEIQIRLNYRNVCHHSVQILPSFLFPLLRMGVKSVSPFKP
jgi:hypothetical protein